MTSWLLKWKRKAVRELTVLWNQSSEKVAVTKAVHQLEQALREIR